MRVLIVTAGSYGDVAPFTGLGQRLEQAGHDVAIAAHGLFADLVRGCGLEFRLLPGDPVAMARARTAAPTPGAGRAVFAEFLERLGDGVIAAVAAGADVVLTAFGASPLSRTVAEGFGIPSVGAYLLPGVPTAQFPLPGSPEPDLGSEGNLFAGREMLRRAGELYGDVLPAVRARLDLPTVATPHSTGAPDGWPICHGYSPLVVPRPADWPAEVHVTGYWWPAVPIGWQPPRELVDFLQAGGATVFIGFGSMVPQARESLSELVAAAVRRADVRAVVQTGWADLAAHTDDILLIGDVPHEWLFPQMAAVVHHAVAGTTAAGLRAGVPAVAVPVLLDQPFWAARLHRLGVTPDPLLQRELTADALAAAIRTCVDDAGYRERAADVARRIRAEDGTAAALEVVNEATG